MLSDEKVTHLSHLLMRGLLAKKLVALRGDEAAARKVIKRVVAAEMKAGEQLDAAVRKKIESYARKIVEGSPEWEILYRKFYQEEETKRGRAKS
ncbi:MAG: DUF507 family protein [Nitrospiraceae bacterium]|nr:DUF507 family protein [Nitrospiraceae bacterium]